MPSGKSKTIRKGYNGMV